jgi:hypothetical protein
MWQSNALAQVHLSTYIDAGKINISEWGVVKTALMADYRVKKLTISTGGQLELAGPSPNAFTGFYLKGGYGFAIKNFPFDVQGIFLLNPYSEIIHEWNLGLQANVEKPHFTWKLGTGFRKYYITDQAREDYDIEESSSLYEKWNLLYEITYTLKPRDHIWNAGISITNLDYFLINQETNPMIYIRGSWNFSTPFTLYAEAWYKSAGTFNISANSFGYFFRTGLIWKLS